MAKETKAAEQAPDPIRREGHPEGPETVFCAVRRQMFHLDALGQPVYHEVPEGYAFDARGRLQPRPDYAFNRRGELVRREEPEAATPAMPAAPQEPAP